jgi:hypothetical protein
MSCCGKGCCPPTTSYVGIEGDERPRCWPDGLPQTKDQIQAETLGVEMQGARVKSWGAKLRPGVWFYVLMVLVGVVVGNVPELPKHGSISDTSVHLSSSPLTARWSCHAPKKACGEGCYDPMFSNCCVHTDSTHGLCPVTMSCCGMGCCPSPTICVAAVASVKGVWCWPSGLPTDKDQIPTSAIKVDRIASSVSATTLTILSQPSFNQDAVNPDRPEKRGSGTGAGGHGSLPIKYSGAARPTIPRLFQALVFLRSWVAAVADIISPGPGGEVEISSTEKRKGAGGHASVSMKSSGKARPSVSRLFQALLLLRSSVQPATGEETNSDPSEKKGGGGHSSGGHGSSSSGSRAGGGGGGGGGHYGGGGHSGAARPTVPRLSRALVLLRSSVVGSLSANATPARVDTSSSEKRDPKGKKGGCDDKCGRDAESSAAKPAIPSRFRTLALLKYVVTNPVGAREVHSARPRETLRVYYPNNTQPGGHSKLPGRGGPPGVPTHSSASRASIPSLFSLLLSLTPSRVFGVAPSHPSLPIFPLEKRKPLDKRWSCIPPKMSCGTGCYNVNNSTCCYVPGWHATGICAWGYECCGGFCCDEGWLCHEGKSGSESMCWPPSLVNKTSLAARATSEVSDKGVARKNASKEAYVAADDGHGVERQWSDGGCALGVCWDAIAFKVTSSAAYIAVSFMFVGGVVLLVSIGIVSLVKRQRSRKESCYDRPSAQTL